MKLHAIHDSFQSCSIAELEHLEIEIEAKLPVDYKHFLLQKNGGFIHHEYVHTYSGISIQRLYGLAASIDVFDLRWNHMRLKDNGSDLFLPVGSDTFGNEIILSLHGIGAGGIYFWDHEEGDFEEAKLERLADSFNSFIENLSLESEEPNVELTGL